MGDKIRYEINLTLKPQGDKGALIDAIRKMGPAMVTLKAMQPATLTDKEQKGVGEDIEIGYLTSFNTLGEDSTTERQRRLGRRDSSLMEAAQEDGISFTPQPSLDALNSSETDSFLEAIIALLEGKQSLADFSKEYPQIAKDFLPVANEVLETPKHIIQWIQQPLLALSNQRPIDLLVKGDISPVVEELYRLEYGVHSNI